MTPFQPFWRSKSLSSDEETLLRLLAKAHQVSTFRNNASTSALEISANGSGSLTHALCAALSTLGLQHGPIRDAQLLLESDDSLCQATRLLDNGRRIPGWGSSFKDEVIDHLWADVTLLLEKLIPDTTKRIDDISSLLASRFKPVRPNAACLTAASNIALGVPSAIAEFLFVRCRLDSWTQIALMNLKSF